MEIKSESYKLEVSHGELWVLCTTISNSLRKLIETHYVRFYEVFRDQEEISLSMLKTISCSLSRSYIYDNIFKYLEEETDKYKKLLPLKEDVTL